MPTLPPNRLSREFDSGRMTRAEFQQAMASHARALIAEMEESHRHPITAYIESLRNRRAAGKLAAKHGEVQVRAVLAALAEVPDFPPADLLWNAGDRHIPLFCFLRMRIPPLFRVNDMEVGATGGRADVEYQFGAGVPPRRERISMGRDWRGELRVIARAAIR